MDDILQDILDIRGILLGDDDIHTADAEDRIIKEVTATNALSKKGWVVYPGYSC